MVVHSRCPIRKLSPFLTVCTAVKTFHKGILQYICDTNASDEANKQNRSMTFQFAVATTKTTQHVITS